MYQALSVALLFVLTGAALFLFALSARQRWYVDRDCNTRCRACKRIVTFARLVDGGSSEMIDNDIECVGVGAYVAARHRCKGPVEPKVPIRAGNYLRGGWKEGPN